MTRRIFIDVESTGNGDSLYHSFVELKAKYYEDECLVSEFHAYYGHHSKTVYSGGINYKKAVKYSQEGHKSADERIAEFTDGLDSNLGDKKAFFISYNCNGDYRLVMNGFKRTKIKKTYFYNNCVCIMVLCACAFDKFMTQRECAEKMNIEVDYSRLHSAEYDVTLAVDIHERLLTQLKSAA